MDSQFVCWLVVLFCDWLVGLGLGLVYFVCGGSLVGWLVVNWFVVECRADSGDISMTYSCVNIIYMCHTIQHI